MANVREFEEYDWNGMSGAERWPNGDSPLVREEKEWLAAGDANGITILTEHYMADWHVELEHQGLARAFLTGLPEELTREQLDAWGFDVEFYEQIPCHICETLLDEKDVVWNHDDAYCNGCIGRLKVWEEV